MAKRFIDTGIFDDPWFMDLSKDGKILWLYFKTKCNHAGILNLNIKLCKVQTGVNDIPTVIKELGNRLVTLPQLLYFIPEFVEEQYPGFPDCKFKAALSALDILEKLNLIKNGKVTLTEELSNSYSTGKSIGIGKGKGNSKEEEQKINVEFEAFWNLYDKKVGDKDKIVKKWNALSDHEREAAMEYIPKYISSRPEKQFRKDPSTFLNNKSWNDEIIAADKRKAVSGIYLQTDVYKPENTFSNGSK